VLLTGHNFQVFVSFDVFEVTERQLGFTPRCMSFILFVFRISFKVLKVKFIKETQFSMHKNIDFDPHRAFSWTKCVSLKWQELTLVYIVIVHSPYIRHDAVNTFIRRLFHRMTFGQLTAKMAQCIKALIFADNAHKLGKLKTNRTNLRYSTRNRSPQNRNQRRDK